MIVTNECESKRELLFDKFQMRIEADSYLKRAMVSAQANKQIPFYSWFKYKEGFSVNLVGYFLKKYNIQPGHILDPFTGSGTTLLTAKDLGWASTGIELMPVGPEAIKAVLAAEKTEPSVLKTVFNSFWANISSINGNKLINHIPITKGAFPPDNEKLLNKYMYFCDFIEDENLKTLLRFAAFSVLEDISYTRKDGQYLRWDYRARGQSHKSSFIKSKILTFEEALRNKINAMIRDIEIDKKSYANLDLLYSNSKANFKPNVVVGSSFEKMPALPDKLFNVIFTSPPYCNRYDYTRTYALELVFLGYNDEEVKKLRQDMLSCTVENRSKIEYLKKIYDNIGRQSHFDRVLYVYQNCEAMQEVNTVLEKLNKERALNNSNIPRMVKNYFLEMCFIIHEMHRVLKNNGYIIMVNDNVRYGGEEIPVDLILSEFASQLGLTIEKIWILTRGKGNSSQQMGSFGRSELRKCVYIWRKDNNE